MCCEGRQPKRPLPSSFSGLSLEIVLYRAIHTKYSMDQKHNVRFCCSVDKLGEEVIRPRPLVEPDRSKTYAPLTPNTHFRCMRLHDVSL